MTDYLQLARERAAGSAPSDASNPYLSIAQERQQVQQKQARFAIEQALKDNPDLAAERQRLSQTSGLPLSIVERNLDEIRRKEAAAAIDLARMAQDSPVLARQIMDPQFTSVAVDDLSTLQSIGKFVGDLGGSTKAGVFRASRGAAGTFQAGFELLAPALDFLEPVTVVGGNPLRRLAEGFAMQGQAAGQTASIARPKTDGVIESGFFSGIESLTQNLLALPMVFAPGGQGAALTMMTASTGGDAYQQAREKGLPMSQALPFAASQAAVEYATEKLPLGKLLQDVKAGTPFFRTLLGQIRAEVPREQIATVLQDLNEWAILNPEKPFSSYLEERPSAAAQTLVATIVGAGGNVAVVKGLETMMSRAVRDGANMQQAGLAAQALRQAMQGAEASRLRERSPEQFRAVMSEMSQDGSLYVDAEVLNQMPAEVLSRMEGVVDALPDALAANAPVAVKLADALTVLPGTPQAEVFMQNARTSPDAPSLVEAEAAGQKAQEFLQQEAERVIAQAADQEALRQSQELVKTNIKQQLAATGRFRDAVNEGYATWAAAFYTAYGSRLGMTPEQFYAKYPLRVLGAPVGQQTGVLNAGEQKPGQLDGIEAYHWSMAARPTLSSAFYGTGLKGSARDEIMSYPDQRVRQRLSFYVDKGTGVRPEAGVGGVAHRATLNNIYDANLDPLKLRGGNAREFETRVLDAGFDGYLDRLEGDQPGQVIMLGDRTVQPEVLGPLSRVESGQQVPALQRREAPWQTQASGTPEQLQARLERMQSSPAWGDYDLRIEGNELQVRKRGGVFEQSRVKDMTPAVRKLLKNLTPAEQRKITDATAAKIIAQLKKLPPAREMAAVALGGKAKRGWYKQSAEAISAVFGQDGPRFAALLAATSPQRSVEVNLLNALNTWKNWTAAGRPTDRETIIDVMGASVQGGRGRASVLDAWINNSVRALTADNPADAETSRVFLSGPKVNSFFLNLIGVTDEVTNDAWMANYALVDQVMFSGSMNVLGTDPGKGSGYLAMAARTREAAAFLTKLTGETWTPAEVQETVWSWAKTLYEMQVGDMTATRALSEGRLTDDLINSTPDFSSLFNDPTYGAILTEAGYGDRLDSLGGGTQRDVDAVADEGAAARGEAGALAPEDQRRLQLQAAKRLERLRAQRAAGVLEQSGGLSGRPQQAGNGAGRYSSGSLAPLEGAPTVAGAAGPDPRLVAVAEQYARDNGIPLRRQAAYAKVDPERAARIAAAYEAMPHAPQDPAVREAYDDLARQTMAQYQALVDAGYQFWFMDPAADPYQGNPWNAMRDLRANQSMAVFPTESGFGTGEFDPEGNPLLADTGLEWAYGSPDGQTKRVLFNDLFRAVHDAFGHGLEGAGFRAQGEENAWQAHVRLFTGPAVGAITSETRGQNSWLNYGPNGAANQTAKVEDTVFADQKTGLMPEWTWSEGRVADEQQVLEQAGSEAQREAQADAVYSEIANDQEMIDALEVYMVSGDAPEGALNDKLLAYIGRLPPVPADSYLTFYRNQPRGARPWMRGWSSWTINEDQTRYFGGRDFEVLKRKGVQGLDLNRLGEYRTRVTGDYSQYGSQGEWLVLNESVFNQQVTTPRGTFNPQTLELVLNPNADLSTWFHETGHFFLEVLADVASQPGAPAQITEDYNKVLTWFGVTPEQWAGFSLDEKRPYHERWAESIEQYVMEGKAPSVELQGVMRRFSAWLKSVYKSITQFVAGKPELELNDDIRRVMDRMLATDEQIAQANEVAGFMPDEQADGEAAERLQKRSIADLKWSVKARDKVIAKLKKQAREVEKATREQVTVEVNAMPEVLAKAAIEKAEKEFEADPMSADMNIAAIADSFPEAGWTSVDAMYRAIELFGDKQQVIDGLTEQRMLEENGDLIDERAIQEAANEAVHNEARARSLATELRTQGEMLGQRTDTGEVNARGAKITVNALVEAAKQFGANVIARTPLKELKATAWKHTAAERRAGKRWAEATAKGETREAVQAKQDQVLNNAAAKAAIDAATEAKKILEFFKRVTKGNDEKTVEKGRDPDIVNAARAVLAAYGIQTPASKGAVAYLEAVKANDPDTYSAIEPMIAAATQNAQPLEALTFEELQGLHESIQAMWFLAKRSRQMEVAGDLLDIDDVAQDLYTRLEEIGIPDRVPGEGMAVTQGEERTLFLQQGIAFLRRVEQWAEGMDGQYGGPFLRYIFQPIKDAADRYRKERIDYRKKFQALVDNLAPIVGDSVIQAPELGYTFGTPGSTAGTAMNEILHAVLHTGNDSNKRKLLLGRGWATENPDGTLDTSRWDAFLGRLVNEGKLERAHFDFVQGVWDLLEQTKPLAQKAHRDAFGRYFSEVTANAFVDPFGVTRRGGYVPAQVDSRQVKDNALRKLAEEENNSMAYAFPQPAMGFTKSRTEYNKPLMLDLRTLSQHLDKVLLFSHMTNPARDVRKLLMRPKVSQPLNRVQPAAVESMLQPWLQRSAQQIVEDPIVGTGKWARIPGIVRSRAGMALMFANVSNAIQQITGLAGAAVRVKPAYLMRSLAQYVASPVKFSQAVWGASPYMDDRAKNEVAVMNEQMQAILIKPSTFQKAQDFSMRHAYFLQTALDNVLSPIVWTGALNQALADGMSEQDAIRFADSTVRQTQGSTLPEDVSRFETGPAYARAFTQFVSYFNMMANTNGTALKQIADEVGLKKGAGKALYVVMMGFMAPIWVAEAIAQAFRGGPEDEDEDGYLDDWLASVFGMGTLKGLLAQVPILGQFGVAAANRFNDNPLDDRVSLSPAISLLESSVSAPESVYKAIVEDGSAQKAIRDVATLVSVATGVPVYSLARPLGYAAGVAQGKIEPTSAADAARGLVTGTASPESKVR